MIYTDIEERCKGDSPVELQASESTPLPSKLLLREKPWCGWIQTTTVYI